MSWASQITFLFVADLDRSEGFYVERLGLRRVLDQGSCRILETSGGAGIGLCERPDQVSPGGLIVTFVDVDVEDRVAELRARGVELERPLAYHPGFDITQAFLRDPDGYLVELQRFEDLAWPRPARACMPELPDDVAAVRSTKTFTEETLPDGLRRAHTTRDDTWGRIEIESGLLRYRIHDGGRFVLRPDRPGVVRPGEPHEVEPIGAVRFRVTFLRPVGSPGVS